MNKPLETWEQPTPRSGRPWQLMLLPWELALVFAAVWWVGSLFPRPERAYSVPIHWWLTLTHFSGPERHSIHFHQGTLTVWDSVQGKEVARLRPELKGLECAAYHGPGKVLALGLTSGEVAVFDSSTGKLRGMIPAHTKRVWAVALSPDGKLLATGGGDATVRLWHVETLKEKHLLFKGTLAKQQICKHLEFSPDGKILFGRTEEPSDNRYRYWDVDTGRLAAGQPPNHVFGGFVPGGQRVLYWMGTEFGDPEPTTVVVKVWDLEQGKDVGTSWRLPAYDGGILGVSISPDGTKIAYEIRFDEHHPHKVVVMSLESHEVLCTLKTENPWFLSNHELMTSHYGGGHYVQIWNLSAIGWSTKDLAMYALITAVLVGLPNLVVWLLCRRPSPPMVQLAE